MRSENRSSPDTIDVVSLWAVVRRSGARLIGISMLLGLATLAVLSLVPSRYTSEAQIQIGGKGLNDPFREPKVGGAPSIESVAVKVDKEAIASQVVALRSRDLAEKLVAELELARRAEFNSEIDRGTMLGKLGRVLGISGPRRGESEEERVLSAYYKALQVYQLRDTRVIAIEFTSEDSELAARAANRLAELYQAWLRAQELHQTEDASQWLRPQVEKLAREVAEAEAEVERFRGKANLFRGGGAGSGGLNEQQLADLTAEVTRARAARGDAEARARTARELMQRGNPEAIPEVQRSPVMQALIAQRTRAEREKAEAETSLLPGHPRMKQLNANVADLRRQVLKEAQFIVDGLEKEVRSLALREEAALRSLDEMKARVSGTAGDVAKLASLEGVAKAKRAELERLQASLQAASSRGGDMRAVPLEAQIISKARPSTVPSSPKRLPFAALVFAAALILGLALVLIRELFAGFPRGGDSARQRPVDDAAERPGRPVTQPPASPAGIVTRDPETGVSEAAEAAARVAIASRASGRGRSVARRLIANAGGQGGYRTVVTGGAPGTPVQNVVGDIASALASTGQQVILVDWSETGAGFAGSFGLASRPGIIDLIVGTATFDAVIRRVPGSDVHLIACGSARASAVSLDADRVNLILDALDEAYDHVIVAGDRVAIRDLFLTIQGRFDAGVIVEDGRASDRSEPSGDGMFLGFHVTDFDIIHVKLADPSQKRPIPSAWSEASGEAHP